MKTATLLQPLLLGLAFAQDQASLKDKAAGWLDKAKSYIPSGTPSIPNPVQAAAAAFAAKKVEKINIRNYKRLLQPKLEGEEEWLVYLTGGNKTCFGKCQVADLAWNESIPLLSALPQPAGAPSLHLGQVDCEKEQVFCGSLSTICPAILHFMFPVLPYPNASPRPASEYRYIRLNTSTSTPQDIVSLTSAAPNSRIYEYEHYDGVLNPVDGTLARFGLLDYFGYAIWGMGTTPSWLIMIVLSFVSRQIMSKRALNRNIPDFHGRPGQAQAPAAAAAAPPSPAGRGTPGSAGKGSKKKR